MSTFIAKFVLTAKKNGKRYIENVRSLPWRERWLLLLSLPILVATILPEHGLFKLGIDLPSFFQASQSAGISPKIYLFEIFLLAVLVLFGPIAASNLKELVRKRPPFIYGLTLGLFAFGMFRLGLNFPVVPVLAIRNSAFVWYLFLPILLATARVSSRFFENFAALAINAAFVIFAFTVFACALTFPSPLQNPICWMPQIGLYSIFWWRKKKDAWKIFLAAALGVGIAYGMQFHFQRTTLLGLLIIFVFLLMQRTHRSSATRSLFVALIFFGFAQGIIFVQKKISPPAIDFSVPSNPLVKAQSNQQGLEIFRWSMWQDAMGLFLERPIVGVGYERQVVFRVYKGHGIYVPNDTDWWKPIGRAKLDPGSAAPISGPHNSYLNAIARLGLAGACFALIHALAFILLWRQGFPYSAFLVFAQSIYAFFNVGLEGPVRSALLLISMGLALQLYWRGSAARESKSSLP